MKAAMKYIWKMKKLKNSILCCLFQIDFGMEEKRPVIGLDLDEVLKILIYA